MRLIVIPLLFISIGLFAQTGFVQEGKASFYADKFEGRVTASGERYSHQKATCAHLSLPFGSLVKVTNLSNNMSMVLRVNDRGPFVPNRIIDLSRSAAEKLGLLTDGLADVRVELLDEQGNMVPALTQSEPTSAYKPTVSETQTQKHFDVKPAQPAKEVVKPEPTKQPATKPVQASTPEPQSKPVVVAATQPETIQASE
jgi:rare lipoprotein A